MRKKEPIQIEADGIPWDKVKRFAAWFLGCLALGVITVLVTVYVVKNSKEQTSGLVTQKSGNGTVAPPAGDGTVAPPVGNGTVAPPAGDGPVAPPAGDGTVAPPVGNGTVAPPAGNGTVAPPVGNGTVAPPRPVVPGHINSITGMRTYVSFLTDGLAKPIDVGGLPAGDRALGGFSASAKTHYKDSIVGKVPNSGDFPHARFVRGQHLGRKKANPNGTSIQFNANGLPVVPSGYHFSAGDWFFRYAGNDQPMALYPAKQGFCILEPTAGAFSPFCLIALSSLAHPTNAPIRLDVTSLQFDNVAKKIRLTPVMTRDLDDLLRSENLLGAGAAFKRELLPMPPDPLVSSGGAELDLSIYDTIPLQFAVRPNETRELFNNAVRMFDLLSVLEAIRQREKIHKVKRDGAKAHTAAKRHALEQVAMKVKAGIERDLILNARDDRAFQRALVVLAGTQPRQLVLQIKQAFQDWQEALRIQKDTEQQIFGKPALVGQQNLLNQMAAWFMQRNDPISKGIAAKFNAIHKSGNLWEAQRVVQQLKNMQTAAANGTLQQVADWMNFCASHDFLLRLRAPDGQTFPLIYFKR